MEERMCDVILRKASVSQTLLLQQQGGCEFLPASQEPLDQLLEQEREIAYNRGLKEGERRGYEKGCTELESQLHFLQRLSEKLLEEKEALFHKLRPEIIELCMAICEKVMRRHLSNPEGFANWVSSLIDSLPEQAVQEPVHVILSPEDYRSIEPHYAQLQQQMGSMGSLHFHSDASQVNGVVRVETKLGFLNSSLERTLDCLKTQLIWN